jgi:hypothetical protein
MHAGGDTPGDPNLGPGIQPLSLSASEKLALVEFMKALTDDRVRFEKAPFDHPQLCVANGEKSPVTATSDPIFKPEAVDNMVEIRPWARRAVQHRCKPSVNSSERRPPAALGRTT